VREKVKKLTDLPSIGKSLAANLAMIDIEAPQKLRGKDHLLNFYMLLFKNF
jgi:hypothetical protein